MHFLRRFNRIFQTLLLLANKARQKTGKKDLSFNKLVLLSLCYYFFNLFFNAPESKNDAYLLLHNDVLNYFCLSL